MPNEIELYQAAKAEFEKATKRCEQIVATISQASNALRNWRRVMVSNASVGFPAEIALGHNVPSIDANRWVTGAEIGLALAAYHQAYSEMRNAYNAIPATQRDVVVPPPA